MAHICVCEDSYGIPHNKEMTDQEFEQDGMCATCAAHVWEELHQPFPFDYVWRHGDDE